MLRTIDRYAFGNRLRMVDPAQKAAIAGIAILLCLWLDRPAVGLLTIGWMAGLAIGCAGIPLRVFVTVVGAESLFLGLSLVSIVVGVSLEWPGTAIIAWPLGPFWVSVSHESLAQAAHLLSRVLGCVTALNLLILTTPLVDVIELLRRLRAPLPLIEVMMISYRAIFVLLDTLDRMVTAQTARSGYDTWRASLRSAALAGSRLFVAAYQRSQALERALNSRGFSGELRVLPLAYQSDRRLALIGVAMTASLLIAGWLG